MILGYFLTFFDDFGGQQDSCPRPSPFSCADPTVLIIDMHPEYSRTTSYNSVYTIM